MAQAPKWDTDWAKGLLRGVGLRATAARIAILKVLASGGLPLSHAEVVTALNESRFDQSTLFRCLNEMSEGGLLARLDLGDQVRRFELTSGAGTGEPEHAHFMCVDCGRLSCLDGFSVSISPSRGPRRDKLGTITEVLLRGHCGACATK